MSGILTELLFSKGRCPEQQRLGCEQEKSQETHSLLPVRESVA